MGIKFLRLMRTPTRWALFLEILLICSSKRRLLSILLQTPNSLRHSVDLTSWLSYQNNIYGLLFATKCHCLVLAQISLQEISSVLWRCWLSANSKIIMHISKGVANGVKLVVIGIHIHAHQTLLEDVPNERSKCRACGHLWSPSATHLLQDRLL